jgi:hypothetical protein
MEEILASVNLDSTRSIHIAQLGRQTIIDSGAEHLGFGGYFIFEANDTPSLKSINVLGKVASLEAAFHMADLWAGRAA